MFESATALARTMHDLTESLTSSGVFKAGAPESGSIPSIGLNSPKRVGWIDFSKGGAIILVVFGHVSQGIEHSTRVAPLPIHHSAETIIYSFHMPAFFLISGILLSRSVFKPAPAFLRGIFATLVWPYLVWSIIGLAIGSYFSQFYQHPLVFSWSTLPSLVWNPGGFWFLYVLALAEMVVLLARRMNRFVCFTVLAGLFAILPAPKNEVFERLFFLLPFLYGGLCSGGSVHRVIPSSASRRLVLVLVLTLLQAAIALSPLASVPLVRLVLGFMGTFWLICIGAMIEATRLHQLICRVGEASLVVFLLHPYFQGATRAAMLRLHFENSWLHLLLQTLLAVIGPVLVWHLTKGRPWCFLFRLNPSTLENRAGDPTKPRICAAPFQ